VIGGVVLLAVIAGVAAFIVIKKRAADKRAVRQIVENPFGSL
jgi:uncharacterized membrane protein